MRNNQPVTDSEYKVPEGVKLVSETDIRGSIIDCNDAFETASGFSKQQLINQPHNIVRHPDVPADVFADMWDTLKRGNAWSQIVKNRRSDGGFYWVKANATPVYENGKISGFMSVRTAACEEEIALAIDAYKMIASGQAKIQSGRVIKGMDWGKRNFFKRLQPQYQLTFLFVLFYLLPYSAYAYIDNHSLATVFSVFILGLIPPFIYGRNINHSQLEKCHILKRVSSGEKVDFGWTDPNTLDGKLQNSIQSASLVIQARMEEAACQLDKAEQLKSALDQLSSNVMIADKQLDIIYLNKQMMTFLKERETQLQKDLPDFKAEEVLGSNIDVFHKHPAHNRSRLESIQESCYAPISVAGYKMGLNVIPVLNRNKERVSTIVEWQDNTAEFQLMDEVGTTVKHAKEGLLNHRIDLEKTSGVALALGKSVNELLESIEKPINETVDVAVALSRGDLTHYVQGEFLGRFSVLQDSLNVAVDNLNSMMGQTLQASQSVAEGTDKISQGSFDLNERSKKQAASLEETAASMEEMTSTVNQNAQSAREAASLTQKTAISALQGVNVMEEAIASMEKVRDSSQKIHEIIGLIDSIAFQTNLLALNAAVEAARAGEHGRGFAVVAGEVRTLAQKSADASKEIRALIEDSVDRVTEGTDKVQKSGDALHTISESIENVNQLINSISQSSDEQSRGIGQLNESIAEIDNAVQQNTLMVEDTSETAAHLSSMSSMMTNSVKSFKMNPDTLNRDLNSSSGSFDFAAARRAHRQWRVNIRAYINDIAIDFDHNTAADGTACALGKWIYGLGKEYQHIPSYQKLEKIHLEMHDFIGKIMQMKDQGRVAEANQAMAKLKDESNFVIELIDQLEMDIAGDLMNDIGHHQIIKDLPEAEVISENNSVGSKTKTIHGQCCSASGVSHGPDDLTNAPKWSEF